MNDIENKEETVVEFTKAELNEWMRAKAREIVEENYRMPTEEDIRKLLKGQRTKELLNRLRVKKEKSQEITREDRAQLMEVIDLENTKELAAHVVELHMNTRRSEAVLGAFKNCIRRCDPLTGSILIEEIDRAMTDYKAEPTE